MTDQNLQTATVKIWVNNPGPCFVIPEGITSSPFSLKLMAKADGFTESIGFDIASAFLQKAGKRKRKPPVQRRRAMNALLMAMCFYYDPVSNRVQRSLGELAIECGLARDTASGDVAVDRAFRAVTSLEKDYGFITCVASTGLREKNYSSLVISFTPSLFAYLGVFPLALADAKIACDPVKPGGEQ